ncbi:conserved hypothetical protein [Burkholderia sp. 8Y]|nr:conserved hypothetical protein [Burkholderia sp. 8Y]
MSNAEKSPQMWMLAEEAAAAVGDTGTYLQVIRGAGVIMETGS